MRKDDILSLYSVEPRGGELHRRPAGRILVEDGNVHHLEDPDGHVAAMVPEGPLDQKTRTRLQRLANHPYFELHSEVDRALGHDHSAVPEAKLRPAPEVTPEMIQVHATAPPPPVWLYQRVGHDRPHVLEHAGGGLFTLDGNPLSSGEVQQVLFNLGAGAAVLRYRNGGAAQAVLKAEQAVAQLRKAEEEDLDTPKAFRHLQAAAEAGHVPHEVVRHLRRQVYGDSMVPTMGNKFAFKEFNSKQRPGVFVSLDGNDFREINTAHGHETGDAAIKAFGEAARAAMDEAVGRGSGKLFRNPDEQNLYRNGGDEFVAYVPTGEHAALFARKLREKLEAIPPVGGTHQLSMSMGFGPDYKSADTALYHAKEQKYLGPEQPGLPRPRRWAPGQVPNLAHSLIPGAEGPVPLEASQTSPQAPEVPPASEKPLLPAP